ncbi:MAG: YihA family ribosome biogenesis GTP-binding protein [Gammaproteobacteria bacterium]|jgi:GTP-binding protein|nr:YihA family ribosome biogenesis GTP-binding protein [Gammaproteobacteria bacterium]MBT3722392.1 YihA family ribosome biogenesis GTP-binding protein [Gammaproteobacteria bacterium]MBT4075298.1 YihA family ribosome biogenesis GTP-binding protein [Gammaproteobacteria bacterium]MBT4196200.1 YihA family ribosome biogenesis GTP-binding protein [Gammaproteobacteria bacterium]MBT4861240.1 YihA family ribosome biogenesis GTP-binding protein [Gammaproteobacteria bacterium]
MPNLYQKASYLTSAFELSQLVEDVGLEIAFAGRSNAGKSTAINRLTNQKNLCKTSKTPGRTQLINFFELDDERRLVDLPGYGFAKVPKKLRQHWNTVLSSYLLERKSLSCLIIVVDIRRGMTDMDWGLIELMDKQLPIHILLTKADKLKNDARKRTIMKIEKELSDEDISVSAFSALSGLGLDEFIDHCNKFLEVE